MKLLGLIVALFTVASADDTKKGPLVTDKVSLSLFDDVKVLWELCNRGFSTISQLQERFLIEYVYWNCSL